MSTVPSALVPSGTRLKSSLMRATVLVASLAIAVVALTFAPSDSASAQDFAQCDSVDNTPGLGIICDVTVVNNLNVATGVESSTVTARECHTDANTAPVAEDCTESTEKFNTLTKNVSQCNYAVNGGGASLNCSVTVVNTVTGAPENAGTTGATVNQCVGSATGGGTTLNCDPFPATTSGATITQCNDSAIGGGGSTGVTCTVLPSTQSAILPVTINQCNNAANQGGSIVTCDAKLTNNITAAGTTTPTPIETTPIKNTLYDSKTDGIALADSNGTAFLGAGVLMLLAGGLLTAAFATRKVGARR